MPVSRNVEMMAALFQFASEGIIISNREGHIVLANPASENQFGYESGELIGKCIEDLVPRNIVGIHSKHRHHYMENPHTRTMGKGMDLYARRKDDSVFPVEISLSHLATSDGHFVMSFIVDITERKRHEKELQTAHNQIIKLNEELEKRVQDRTIELANAITELARSKEEVVKALSKEKDLNELKSRFVTTASHEFRTPLTAILSSVSLIGRYSTMEDLEKRNKHIDKIKASVSTLTEILNNFLSLGKLEEGQVQSHPVSFLLDEFLYDLVEDGKALLKSGQSIQYKHLGGETSLVLDKQLLKNILLNLLSNAIKYSPEERPIDIISENTGTVLVVNVKDQGIGISQDDQQHLFQRFFRAKNAENIQGTGLGLNIVTKYAELMNGKISLQSELGKGSTFSVEIPLGR